MFEQPTNSPRSGLHGLGLLLALFAIAYTIIVAFFHLNAATAWTLFLVKAGFAVWAVGAPLWFLLEWWWFQGTNQERVGEFQYSQQCARAIWAGIVTVLGAILLK